ncbi:MAG: hypothetical protein IJI88_02260, partial [Atopobiaceae bacterium]|nr:hypothetical protein [Atopobiaceae bacterium]
GVGTVTIQGPHFGEAEPSVDGDKEGESGESQDGSGTDGSGTDGSGESSQDGGSDEVVYGDDAGYYDENGVWQEGYADDWP